MERFQRIRLEIEKRDRYGAIMRRPGGRLNGVLSLASIPLCDSFTIADFDRHVAELLNLGLRLSERPACVSRTDARNSAA